jgi:hypothetical protein
MSGQGIEPCYDRCVGPTSAPANRPPVIQEPEVRFELTWSFLAALQRRCNRPLCDSGVLDKCLILSNIYPSDPGSLRGCDPHRVEVMLYSELRDRGATRGRGGI